MMKRVIKNIITVTLVASSAISCSYKPERTGRATTFKFEFDGLKGTQVVITATPEDYTASFYFDVMTAEQYDSLITSGKTRLDIAQMFVDMMKEYYEEVSEGFKDKEYKASWMDMWYIGPGHSRLFANLTPLTDYYVIAACVKPDTYSAVGEAQTARFTTTEIKTDTVSLKLDFLLMDTDSIFTYYVRPTHKGRISKELYLSDIVADDVLNAPPYDGDVALYCIMWYNERKDVIEKYIKSDICRFKVPGKLVEDKGYTIIAAPFNIGENVPIYTISFKYQDGIMSDGYIPGKVH